MVDVITRCLLMLLVLIIASLISPKTSYVKITKELSIKEIATKDLTVLGHYDMYLHHSLRTRLICIWLRLLRFTSMSPESIEAEINYWVKDNCYDPDMLICNVVNSVSRDFIQMIDSDPEQFKKRMLETELPEAPRTLKFNDYVNVESLDKLYLDLLNKHKEDVYDT